MLRTNPLTRATLIGAQQLERAACLLRGKGFGSFSIRQEVALALRALGRTPSLVIDVGGNKGEYTAEMAARVPDCDIIVFEPAQTNIQCLRERFAGTPQVRVEGLGLSDKAQDATLFAEQAGSGLGSLSRRNLAHFGMTFSHEERIRLVAFDEYWSDVLQKRPIDIVKLDVEGHELGALRGARNAIEVVSVVQFEFGGCNIDSRTFFRDFHLFFDEAGFDIHRVTPLGPEPLLRYTEDAEAFRTTNFLAVRRLP